MPEIVDGNVQIVHSAPRLGSSAPAEPVKPSVGAGAKDWERWFSDPKNRLDR